MLSYSMSEVASQVYCCCVSQMAEARIAENESKGDEYKGRLEEVQQRLSEAESRLHEGELVRRKLHNTILVINVSLDLILLLSQGLGMVL